MLRALLLACALACVSSQAFAFSWSPYSDPEINAQVEISSASTSRECLTGETHSLLAGLEARVGRVKVISTCRPGAIIAGTNRPSQHRYGKAVDFMPTPGQRVPALAWLRANARGAVITYGSGHIHFDTGDYRWSGSKRR